MKDEDDRVRHVIWCECGSPEDMAVLSYFTDSAHWRTVPMLYLDVHLYPYRPWWQRFVKGVRYIFGGRSCYGDFNEVVISPREAGRIMRFLQQFLYDIDNARVNRE